MPFATRAMRDRARKRLAAQVKAGAPCALCRMPIDLAIPYPDPMSFTVEHVIPTSHGGADYGDDQLVPSHFTCNRARSNGPNGTVGRNSGSLEP